MEVIKTEADEMIESNNDGGSWMRGKLLGEGTLGAVYVATSKTGSYPRVMAVKSADISCCETLQHERRVMSSLAGCSSVIQCFGEELTHKRDGSEVYNLLLEYGSGGTLSDRIETMGNGLPESEVRWYTRSLVEGLIKIHKAGFVHCDLKPENILLFPITKNDQRGPEKFQFQAKICDFGLAKGVKEDGKKSKLFRTWNGTVGYVPPEAAEGRPQESPADIWGLGIIVLEMLTGHPAYYSENKEIIRKLQKRAWLPEISQDLSPMAKSFLHSCLRTRVKERAAAKSLLRHPFIAGIQDAESSTHSLKFQKIAFVLHRFGSFLSLV